MRSAALASLLLLTGGAGTSLTEERIEEITDVLGLEPPYDIILDFRANQVAGSIRGATGNVLFCIEDGSRSEPVRVHLGAILPSDPAAREILAGSAEDAALRDVFRVFCEEHQPHDQSAETDDKTRDSWLLRFQLDLLDTRARWHGRTLLETPATRAVYTSTRELASSRIVVSDPDSVGFLSSLLAFNAKTACLCEHVDTLLLENEDHRLRFSLCEHCLDLVGQEGPVDHFWMPAPLWDELQRMRSGTGSR